MAISTQITAIIRVDLPFTDDCVDCDVRTIYAVPL